MDRWTRTEARGALLAVVLLAVAAAWSGVPARDAPPARRPAAGSPAPPAAGGAGPLDLNRADARALESLPGIGPVLAERIIEHRGRHGDFETIDDLAAVRGIGPRLIERLRDRIRVQARSDSVLR